MTTAAAQMPEVASHTRERMAMVVGAGGVVLAAQPCELRVAAAYRYGRPW